MIQLPKFNKIGDIKRKGVSLIHLLFSKMSSMLQLTEIKKNDTEKTNLCWCDLIYKPK